MKILIGIMYCIENEFEECIQSIQNQTHKDFQYFIIKDLPNKQAHNLLYESFMSRANEFDLFVKIDADMVICRESFFEEIIKTLNKNPTIDHLQIGVQDFYTNRIIQALHVYRNNIKWDTNTGEKIFVDFIHEELNSLVLSNEKEELVPAAHHCPNPSFFQSFHFGVHKIVKVLKINENSTKPHLSHVRNIQLLYKELILTLDRRKAFALFGARWALKNQATFREVDFNSEKVKAAFQIEKSKRIPANIASVLFFFLSHYIFLPSLIWGDYLVRRFRFDIRSNLRFIINRLGKRWKEKVLRRLTRHKIVP